MQVQVPYCEIAGRREDSRFILSGGHECPELHASIFASDEAFGSGLAAFIQNWVSWQMGFDAHDWPMDGH